MSWVTGKGWNFRQTASHATDGTDEVKWPTADNGNLDGAYPISGNGTNYGRTLPVSSVDGSRDNLNFTDRRLAGIVFRQNTATQFAFRVDLPATGLYRIRLGGGRYSFGPNVNYVRVLDDATALITLAGVSTGNDQFYDAAGNVHTLSLIHI